MESKDGGRSATANAINKALAAWKTNTTFASYNWRQRQLYGLFGLLIEHREELIQALCMNDSSLQSLYQQDFAVVLTDIARRYTASSTRHSALWSASNEQHELPTGVSILLVDGPNPIRDFFGALVANIVVGNTVIISGGAQKADRFWPILQREMPKYLDPEALHVVPNLDRGHDLLRKVDLITVVADKPDPYAEILQLPFAKFINTQGGSSLVVVDEGRKSFEELTSQILESYRFHGLRREAVNAVFIREIEMAGFRNAFNSSSATATTNTCLRDLSLQESFRPFSPCSVSIDLSNHVGVHEKEFGLAKAIDLAYRARLLLIISYRSLDHVIDALRRLKPAPDYLTLLCPYDKASSEYFQKWTASQFYSLGAIRLVVPYGFGRDGLFPTSACARLRTCWTGRIAERDQPLHLDKIEEEVRAIVQKPKAAPNQTVDFFEYMNRVAMCVGAAVGTAALTVLYVMYSKRKPG